MRFSISSGGSPDDTGQWPVLPSFDMVLSGLTALGCQQGRRVGTPGLQSGRLGSDFIFWFDWVLPPNLGRAWGEAPTGAEKDAAFCGRNSQT